MQNKKLKFFILFSFITINSFSQTSDKDYIERGKLNYSQQKYTKAYEDFNKAVEINPKNADAYFNLALVFDKVFPSKTTESINLKISFLNAAIELNPNYTHAYFYRGIEKYYLKEYRNAISDYNIIIEKDKENFQCYTYRGMAKAELKDNNGAMSDFNKAIEINPKDAFVYGSRGYLKFNLNQKEAACLDFSRAVELGDTTLSEYVEKFCN